MGSPQMPAPAGRVVGPFTILRELGARSVPTFIARLEDAAPGDLLVLAELAGDELVEAARQDAELATSAQHPNLVSHVRCVEGERGEILVTNDYVDGEWLGQLRSLAEAAASPPRLEVMLRVVVDMLTGVQWLHQVNRARPEPRKPFHGQLSVRTLIVGLDGVARIANPVRTLLAPALRGALELAGYLAPEAIEGAADVRSDVYSVGVILRECLRAAGTDAPWAASLAEVADRAAAEEAKLRFATPAEMLAQLRKAAGLHVAQADEVAAFVERVAGERIHERRRLLDVPPANRASVSDVRERPSGQEAAASAVDSEPPDAMTMVDINLSVDVPGSVPPPAGPPVALRAQDDDTGTTASFPNKRSPAAGVPAYAPLPPLPADLDDQTTADSSITTIKPLERPGAIDAAPEGVVPGLGPEDDLATMVGPPGGPAPPAFPPPQPPPAPQRAMPPPQASPQALAQAQPPAFPPPPQLEWPWPAPPPSMPKIQTARVSPAQQAQARAVAAVFVTLGFLVVAYVSYRIINPTPAPSTATALGSVSVSVSPPPLPPTTPSDQDEPRTGSGTDAGRPVKRPPRHWAAPKHPSPRPPRPSNAPAPL